MPLSDFPRLNTPLPPKKNLLRSETYLRDTKSWVTSTWFFFKCSAMHSATAIYNVFMSERSTNWCFAQYTCYTLFSGHCYFLTFRLCCFVIFQGKYYESSLKLKMFQSSNYTLEVPVHNGHLWLFLQGHLPDSPKGGRIKIPQNTLCLSPPPRYSWDSFGGHITKRNWKQLLTQSVLWGFENS